MRLRLQIVSTGEFLVLAENGVLTVELQSTLFNNETDLLGSFSFDSTMPLAPNKALLQNAHLITSGIDQRSFDVRMILGYLPYKLARFNFSIDNDTILYHLYIDTTVLASQLRKLKLNGLATSGVDESKFFLTVDEYKAYMTSTISAEPGTMPMVFFPFKNDGAYREITPESQGDYPYISFPVNKYMNGWKITDGTGSFQVDNGAGPFRQTQVPFFYVTYILKRICKFFGLTPVGKWLKEPAANRIVMHTNISTAFGFGIPDYLFFMPDIGVNEFLMECRRAFGLLIDPDLTNQICYIESLENLEDSDESVDLSLLQLYGYRETSSSLKAYQITQQADDKDAAFTDQEKQDLPVVIIGDQTAPVETTDIPLASVATKMIVELTTEDSAPSFWRIPHIKQPVYAPGALGQISDLPYADRNKFKMRFLYWHGMVENANGYLYPYGSADNLDRNLQPIAETTLALTNDGLAFNSVKRKFEFMKNSKPVEISFYLTREIFARLKPNTRIIIKDRNRATVNCLMDVAVADLVDGKSTIFAKVTMYPIIRPDNTRQVIPVIPVPPPEPPADNGTVFAKLENRNYTHHEANYPPPPHVIIKQDVYIRFFEDAGMTVPKDVTDLTLRIKTTRTTNGDIAGRIITYYDYIRSSSGYEVLLFDQFEQSSNYFGQFISWEYALEATAHYSVI